MVNGVIFVSVTGQFVQMQKSGSFATKATEVAYTVDLNQATLFRSEAEARNEYKGLAGHFALPAQAVTTVRLVAGQYNPPVSQAVKKDYVVKMGDTLSSISFKLGGGPNGYAALADLNGISSSDLIFPGQLLKIPQEWYKHVDEKVEQSAFVLKQHMDFLNLRISEAEAKNLSEVIIRETPYDRCLRNDNGCADPVLKEALLALKERGYKLTQHWQEGQFLDMGLKISWDFPDE